MGSFRGTQGVSRWAIGTILLATDSAKYYLFGNSMRAEEAGQIERGAVSELQITSPSNSDEGSQAQTDGLVNTRMLAAERLLSR
jgi:hypothetical protein